MITISSSLPKVCENKSLKMTLTFSSNHAHKHWDITEFYLTNFMYALSRAVQCVKTLLSCLLWLPGLLRLRNNDRWERKWSGKQASNESDQSHIFTSTRHFDRCLIQTWLWWTASTPFEQHILQPYKMDDPFRQNDKCHHSMQSSADVIIKTTCQ